MGLLNKAYMDGMDNIKKEYVFDTEQNLMAYVGQVAEASLDVTVASKALSSIRGSLLEEFKPSSEGKGSLLSYLFQDPNIQLGMEFQEEFMSSVLDTSNGDSIFLQILRTRDRDLIANTLNMLYAGAPDADDARIAKFLEKVAPSTESQQVHQP